MKILSKNYIKCFYKINFFSVAHNIELVEKIKQLDGIKNQLDNYKIEDKKEYTQQDRVTELKTLINNLQNDINHFYAASFESDEVRNFGASLNVCLNVFL